MENFIKENKRVETIQKSKTIIVKTMLNIPKYGKSGIVSRGHLFIHPLPLTYELRNINIAETVIG